MATVEELQEMMAKMQATLEEQQKEFLALRQSPAKQAEDLAVQLALAAEERRNSAEERKSLAEERKTLISALASRSGTSDDVVDGKVLGSQRSSQGEKTISRSLRTSLEHS